MTSRRDPFETLRRMNPVNRERLPDASESAPGRALLEEIIHMGQPTTTTTPSVPRRPRLADRMGRPRVLVPVAVAAVLSMGFTVYAMTRDVSEPLTIGCYASADLKASTVVVGADGTSPAAICQAVWEKGDFGPQPVPPLTACVLASGAVGVFPGGQDTCADLDLAPLAAETYPGQAQGFIALRTALVDRFLAGGCLGEQDAVTLVRDELAARGLTDWKVVTASKFRADRPCASLAFEPEKKTVSLVPAP